MQHIDGFVVFAQFALFLSSDESDFFVGQAIPFSGGWAQ